MEPICDDKINFSNDSGISRAGHYKDYYVDPSIYKYRYEISEIIYRKIEISYRFSVREIIQNVTLWVDFRVSIIWRGLWKWPFFEGYEI